MNNLIKMSTALLPTKFGEFVIHVFRDTHTLIEYVALTKGDIENQYNVLTRVHSECLTGDIFSSSRCDCGEQLTESLNRINKNGAGIVVYLRDHEGRGIGLANKVKAYQLQDLGFDTVEANIALDLPVDSRSYQVASQIINNFNIKSIQLLSNNPHKVSALVNLNINVTKQISLIVKANKFNSLYLETKRTKLGHLI